MTAAAAAEGNDLMGSGGLRRRWRRIGKTLSPAVAVGDDVGSERRMGTTSSPPAAGRGGWGSSSGGKTSPLVQCAPTAEGDDDARSESRVERVMTDEA
uniref:DUF834 domain-containing protein n=1 Tax=Oryza glumipatula TaxID=40148 RepID=A0A0E0B061_9ORYZ